MMKNVAGSIDPLWCIAEDTFSMECCKHYEGLFTHGNGYMHVRGSFEEGIHGETQDEEYIRMPANVTLEKPRHPISKWGTFVPGIVGRHPLLKEELINLPWFIGLFLSTRNEDLDMDLCDITHYKRWLDLKEGILYRRFIWHTKSGACLQFEYSRFISMDEKHLCVQRVKVKALFGESVLGIESRIDGNVRTNGYNHFQELSCEASGSGYICMKTLTDNGNTVFQISSMELTSKCNTTVSKADGKISSFAQVVLRAGDEIVVFKPSVITTDRDFESESPIARAYACIQRAVSEGYDRLYEKHRTAWNKKWETSDIKIEGDDRAQLAVRMSIYHLIRACAEDDQRVGICAKGYAGEAYFGRYFWDTEINMLPFFIYTNPKAAKSLMMFRYNTLQGAKLNAKEYGYKGARYPWESSVTGEEQCPNWQYADHEIHITADIVYALLHYAAAAGDAEFVWNFGMEVLIETARYWVTRVDRNPKGYYELIGVMGPDEYLPMTRNNAYTNRMVKFSLKKTIEHLNQLREDDACRYDNLTKRLNVSEAEIQRFTDVEEKLMLPYDQKSELIPQSEDFEYYADIDFYEVWKDRSKPFGHFVSQEKIYRSKALKQADALLLMMLFPNEFTEGQLLTSYEYYKSITTHDSSLSAAVHGAIASWLGKTKEAEEFIDRVIDIDLSANKKGAAEGIHIANCGGLWQLIVFGFAGLTPALWSSEIKLKPKLPADWKRLEFTLAWQGKFHRIIVVEDEFEIVSVEP